MISEQEPQGPAQDGSQTAFRRAEKTFQLHREEVYKTRGRRRVSKGFVVRPTDLSDVLDLQLGAPLPEGVSCIGVPSGMPSNAAAFAFAAHPGLLLVRCAVPPKLQRELVVEAFTRFCEPPNHTNHIRAYPEGLPGIWHAAQQGLRLQQQQQPQQTQQTGEAAGEAARSTAGRDAGSSHSSGFASSGSDSGSNCSNASGSSASPGVAAGLWGPEGSGPLAESLLQKLRWATLGPPYDWTQRRYLQGVPHMPLPAQLHQLAVALAGLAATLPAGTSSGADDAGAVRSTAAAAAAIGSGQAPAFCPDAALVNYYVEGDTLNGHIDDAEPSLDKPLVSLSLGCDAIFLIGSTTKEVPPDRKSVV